MSADNYMEVREETNGKYRVVMVCASTMSELGKPKYFKDWRKACDYASHEYTEYGVRFITLKNAKKERKL